MEPRVPLLLSVIVPEITASSCSRAMHVVSRVSGFVCAVLCYDLLAHAHVHAHHWATLQTVNAVSQPRRADHVSLAH